MRHVVPDPFLCLEASEIAQIGHYINPDNRSFKTRINISNKDEYYEVNTELTKQIFDSFLISDSSVFIMLSSVKAVADTLIEVLKEDTCPPNISRKC